MPGPASELVSWAGDAIWPAVLSNEQATSIGAMPATQPYMTTKTSGCPHCSGLQLPAQLVRHACSPACRQGATVTLTLEHYFALVCTMHMHKL